MKAHDLFKLIEKPCPTQAAMETLYNTMRYNRRRKETNWVTEAEALAQLLVELAEKKLIILPGATK